MHRKAFCSWRGGVSRDKARVSVVAQKRNVPIGSGIQTLGPQWLAMFAEVARRTREYVMQGGPCPTSVGPLLCVCS